MTEDVLVSVDGRTGRLSLNRPKAIHALNLAMCEAMIDALVKWRDDDAIEAVVIDHSEGRGFCAGGDIRMLAESGAKDGKEARFFFHTEYRLNHLLFTYPKPVVAFMDGITMGGGVGISQPAKYRVATEHTRFAMPETGIGLFPDVGGGWFLGQCPGHVGEWLALTGHAISAGDAMAFGLGDVFVQSRALPGLLKALREEPQSSAEHVVATVMDCVDLAPAAAHMGLRERIDRHFGQADVPAILASLAGAAAADDEWARDTHATLLKRSPLMLAVTLEQLRRARTLSLADDLRMERDLVHRCFHLRPGAASETVEGIRALAVDKDHAPRWNPARIEEVTPAMVQAFFDSPWTPEQHPLRALR